MSKNNLLSCYNKKGNEICKKQSGKAIYSLRKFFLLCLCFLLSPVPGRNVVFVGEREFGNIAGAEIKFYEIPDGVERYTGDLFVRRRAGNFRKQQTACKVYRGI